MLLTLLHQRAGKNVESKKFHDNIEEANWALDETLPYICGDILPTPSHRH